MAFSNSFMDKDAIIKLYAVYNQEKHILTGATVDNLLTFH